MFDYLSNTRKAGALSMGAGGIASIALHAAIVIAVVYERTQNTSNDAETWNEVVEGLTYIAPPDISSSASQVQIRYESSGGNDGTATATDEFSDYGPRARGVGPGESAVASMSGGDEIPDQVGMAADDPYENAFSIVEVEQQAERSPESAAPAYPRELMAKGVEGYAAMRFVVDSTGAVDMTSVRVLDFTHPEFVAAVRSAMPGMRFTPARLGEKPVRQLAEQMFSFKMQTAAPLNESATAASGSRPRIPEPQG